MGDIGTLTEMGFSEKKSKLALRKNGNDVSRALEYLIAHAEDPEPPSEDEASAADPAGEPAEEDLGPDAVARSLKCDDCGKLLRDGAAAELHAHRTGHENYSESVSEVPTLSAEERAAQLLKLRDQLAARRVAKAKAEDEEHRRRELERRKQGREGHQAQLQYKEREEAKRAAAVKREKEEDAAHRAKVKAQLEQDRLERMARMNPTAAPAPAASPVVAAAPAAVTANLAESRVQVRLPDNTTLVATFKAEEPLASLRAYVMANWASAPVAADRLQLSTAFPRKVYGEADFARSFRDHGLVPSAAILCRIV